MAEPVIYAPALLPIPGHVRSCCLAPAFFQEGTLAYRRKNLCAHELRAQCRLLFDQHRANFPVLVRRQLPRPACGHGLREQRAYLLAQLRAFVPAQCVHFDHLQVRDLRCPLSCHAASFAASPGVCGSEVARTRLAGHIWRPIAQVLYSVLARELGFNRSNLVLDAGVVFSESASAFLSSSNSCWTSLSLKRTHRLLKRTAGRRDSASHRYTQVGVTRSRSANSRTVSNRSI